MLFYRGCRFCWRLYARRFFPAFETRMITVSNCHVVPRHRRWNKASVFRLRGARTTWSELRTSVQFREEGVSVVTLELDQRSDRIRCLQKLKPGGLDRYLPEEMDRPVITCPQWRRPAISVAVTSPHGEDELWFTAEKVRDELRAYRGSPGRIRGGSSMMQSKCPH